MVPGLAESFRVVVYDRRGHSRSERPDTPGSADEDGDDLAALLEALDLAPAHMVTNSYGGNIALRLATRRPEVFRSLSCHEPPLWSLLEDDPESREILQQGARSVEAVGRRIAQGDHEGAARQFVQEVAFGPGAWENELPAELRAIFVENAPTFLDELKDPNQLRVDEDALSQLELPGQTHAGVREPTHLPRRDRPAGRADPTRQPRDDRRRGPRAPADNARALRRGHDTRGPASRGLSVSAKTRGPLADAFPAQPRQRRPVRCHGSARLISYPIQTSCESAHQQHPPHLRWWFAPAEAQGWRQSALLRWR